ncbi:hypothetical protein [Microbispora sp. GKU 823]|uniref:hypothetical protein n=1 Tax=Microbispora sp. GKU 823 TaxID=1652100 RepID=UPI0009A3C18D|nr:hypothetical protein [Microbispora sp. GKU 823]OPG08059.1 hypothetical protein B1L11_29040 [Microbispora sp. GKU 823]
MTANKTRGRRAALLLAVITPLVAEFTLGNPPPRMAWLLLLWIPIYGAGVVLVRELVRRAGTGWTGVLLLGAAYGIVEEGLALQALSSPTIYGAAGWAPRILGLNSAYAELQIPYHAVFSAAIPILLTDLIVPSLRDRPYLGRLGTCVAGTVFVLGALLLRVTVVTSIDPGYEAPAAILAGCAVAVVLLTAAGLRLKPRPGIPPLSPPAPVAAGVFGAVAAFGYLALLFPFGGATQPAFTHGGWVIVPMSAAAVLAVTAARRLRRWTAGGLWTDRHSLALASGALIAHTAFGLISNTDTAADRLGLAAVGLVMMCLLALLGRKVTGLPRSKSNDEQFL